MTGAVAILLATPGVVVAVSPGSASGVSAGLTVTSNSVTASVSFGVVTGYAWVYVTGDVGIAAQSPSSATTAFSAVMSPGTTMNALFACDVTVGGVVYRSNAIAVNLERL